MVEYAEVTTWSLEDLRERVPEALPEGWKLEQGEDCGHLWFRFWQPRGDGYIVAWESYHLDERTLLLDAYCWLWLRGRSPEDPRWVRQHGEFSQRVGSVSFSDRSPEPFEDLDTEYVRSVYDQARKRS